MTRRETIKSTKASSLLERVVFILIGLKWHITLVFVLSTLFVLVGLKAKAQDLPQSTYQLQQLSPAEESSRWYGEWLGSVGYSSFEELKDDVKTFKTSIRAKGTYHISQPLKFNFDSK